LSVLLFPYTTLFRSLRFAFNVSVSAINFRRFSSISLNLSKSDKSSPRCCSFVFISSKLLRKNFMSSMLISSFFKHKKTLVPILYRDESLVSRVATLVEEHHSSGFIVGNGVFHLTGFV